MTETEFRELQKKQRESGLGLMAYLRQESISYSSYCYWVLKFGRDKCAVSMMAPISVIRPVTASPREGISVMQPNGVQIHFSPSMEESALRFLNGKGGGHV